MNMRCRRCRGEHGASLVEFALLLPLFMMLLLGMLSGGQSYNQKLSLTNAAREGARYGATLSTSSLTGSAWGAAVKSVALERASGDVTESASNTDQGVCVALVGADGTTVLQDGSSNDYRYKTSTWTDSPPANNCFADNLTADTGCRVHVLLSRKGKIEALVYSFEPRMKSSATAHFERTCP
jgi:Flp pilus assembly protein TadG